MLSLVLYLLMDNIYCCSSNFFSSSTLVVAMCSARLSSLCALLTIKFHVFFMFEIFHIV